MIKQYSKSIKNILVQLFILGLFFGCVPTNKLSQHEILKSKKTYQQIAQQKFGDKVDFELNSDENYALCEKIISEPRLNPNQLIEFFVYDIQKGEIIFEDKIANAKISWYNNTQLLITRQKGYITNPNDTGKWTYIFDLQSKKKLPQTIQTKDF
ncbi:hypothetical protein ACXR6G_01005 [Ancylomarina sp. YFZ004]